MPRRHPTPSAKIPLKETLEAFDTLMSTGKIRNWGVTNFDVDDMEELIALSGGDEVATDQVLYNLQHRGIEFDLLPWCERQGVPIMAYSPIEQGRILDHPMLKSLAAKHEARPAQIALAWVLAKRQCLRDPAGEQACPRAGKSRRARFHLSTVDLAELDRGFPPPTHKEPLAVH